MIATYRLQLNRDFTFKHAEQLLDYFAGLGISHLYLSPINTAPPESTHNYDVWDYQGINPVLGGREGFESLVAAARKRGIGIVVDFVPNHMGIEGPGNKWWQDIQKHGQKSKFATYFDINWSEGPRSYRRFFDVDSLAGVAVEREEVFREVHSLILELVREGKIDGLRIDHVDGLANPTEYLQRLKEACGDKIWLLVEKILAPREKLPEEWPIDGTTGYDFLFYLNQLFVDRKNEAAFTRLYSDLTGEKRSFDEVVEESKRLVLRMLFKREFEPLKEFEEEIVGMRVYRTYDVGDKTRTRLQQLTGPVMAKGVEDTAFYRYHRFIGLNEVGGDAGIFGISINEFHEQCRCRAKEMPYSMLATSTHDTKFSEDVRARLAVLTEIPDEWERAVRSWFEMLKGPDANSQYRFLQALVGTWPGEPFPEKYVDRIFAFMLKSVREAKVHTNWLSPNEAWERAMNDYMQKVLSGPEGAPIRKSINELVEKIKPFGERNSVAQVLLKLTCPGVPDIYQGQEIWDFSLVDPDNRRAIDWQSRIKINNIKAQVTRETLAFRRKHPALFTEGDYEPIEAGEHCVAFARSLQNERCTVAVPRFTYHLRDWGNARLPIDRPMTNIFTGEKISSGELKEVFRKFPVALLV